jgi:hypothetical protein
MYYSPFVRICTAFLQQATLPVDGVVNNKIYILFESRGDTGISKDLCRSQLIELMWSGGNTIGSFWKPCHFVPLIPHTVEYSTINIDDYEQVMSMALFKSKT